MVQMWFKFTCRVRALGAFIWNRYLACQQCPETKNLGDDMSATSCKTGTSCVFIICPLAIWQGSGMERAVACREGHYVMYHHISKDAPEVCTSIRTILKANNLRPVLLFCDLLSLYRFLGQLFNVSLLVQSYTICHSGDDYRNKFVWAHKWVWARKAGESLWTQSAPLEPAVRKITVE